MRIRTLSLPTRLSLAVTAVLVLTTVLADVMAMRELRAMLSQSVSASLSGMVDRMAAQIDRDMTDALAVLEEKAEAMRSLPLSEAGDRLKHNDDAIRLLFDYGIILVDSAGTVAADTEGRQWQREAMAGEEFFQRTFAVGRSGISGPFAMPDPEETPVAMFSVPVLDKDGRVSSVLAGGCRLTSNRMLNQATGLRASRFGQIGVFTPDGKVVAHSDKSLLLEQYENPLPETPSPSGAVEITDANGKTALLAVARLPRADWLMAGVFPSAEVYAPIEQGFQAAHRWFFLGLVLCCVLAWLISGRAVRDLGLLAREVDGIGLEGLERGRRTGSRYRGEAAMLSGAINHMLDSLDEAGKDIDRLSAKLSDAEERQRRAIAADLHDSACQNLALATMRLGAIKKRLSGEDGAALAAVQEILEQTVKEVRDLTFDLSPAILYELGLVPALEWHMGEFRRKYGHVVTLESQGDLTGMAASESIFLYRAAGELLVNAAKHADAKTIRVLIARRENEVVLRVEDDGRGISRPAASGTAEAAGGGFGLRSLRQRARQFGGTAMVENRPEGGARATLRVAFRADGSDISL